MNMVKKTPSKLLSWVPPLRALRWFYLITIIFLTAFNFFSLAQEISRKSAKNKNPATNFLGLKFAGLNDTLKGVTHVGYYTNKDLDDNNNAAQLAQAQYVLAPIILDENYERYDYILLDCKTEEDAFNALKKIGAVPLKKNLFGIVLARKIQ